MEKVVLDTNQFIFGFRNKKESCTEILKYIGYKFEYIIPELIVYEIIDRLGQLEGKNYASLILYALYNNMRLRIVPDVFVPAKIIQKYKKQKLKEADAFIAAFTEWIGAAYLVSENRHFLQELKTKPFTVITSEEFLRILKQ